MNELAFSLPFTFEEPIWLWLVLLVPALVALSFKSLAGLEPSRRIAALIVRSLVVLAIAAALAHAVHVRRNTDLTVMFLLDRSSSVPADLQKAQEQYVAEVCKKVPPDDKVGVISFGRHAHLDQLPMGGGYHIEPGRLPLVTNPDRTDVAAAIRLAMAMFPHDTAKRIVLLSDGNDNMGDVLTEAANAAASGVPIDVVPMWYQHRSEVTFDRLVSPSMVEDGEQVPVRLLLHSQERARGVIDLYHNGLKVALDEASATVDLLPGNNAFIFKLPVHGSGPQRFEARFRPENAAADRIQENNVATSFSFIGGPGRVLILSSNPEMDAPLAEALEREKIDVRLQDLGIENFDLLNMLNYSAILLANVPANAFTDEQQHGLVAYVRDMGGGLIMTGGDDAFGAGGWIGSPVEEVMPVDFDIKHKRVIPQGALAIIMHSCEIERGNYWGKEVAKKAVETISSRDLIGIVAYTWSPGGVNWEVPMAVAANKMAIKQRVDRMAIGDMPDFDSAMDMTLKAFQGVARTAAQKHMIIVSDGDPSPPSARVIQGLIDLKVTVSTIGIGYGVHVSEPTLRDIATKTGGRFYPCRNPNSLPQIFVKESKMVRKPLIQEEPFVPRLVRSQSELLTGVSGDELPPLEGMVLTTAKNDVRVQQLLVKQGEESPDPVLAAWQDGLGKSIVFTSGFWPKWGTAWVDWPKYSKVWAQIVRWSLRQEAPAGFETLTQIDGDNGRVIVEALDANAEFLNLLQFQANVVGPDQQAVPLTFTQTGPGRYEAPFKTEQAGQYIANVGVASGGNALGMIHTGVAVPFSPEFREKATNEPLLRQVQETTTGRWLTMTPETDDVFSHDLPPSEARRPAWEWIVSWVLLPLFLLDVAVRRLASWLALSMVIEVLVIVFFLFGVGTAYAVPFSAFGILGTLLLGELIGWSLRFRYIRPTLAFFTHGVTALAGRGERSAASLDKLKGRRDQVIQDRYDADRSRRAHQDAEGAIPLPDRASKFEALDIGTRRPHADLSEQLGGANVLPEGSKPSGPGEKPKTAENVEEATSRLLKAKRRAQRDIDDQHT